MHDWNESWNRSWLPLCHRSRMTSPPCCSTPQRIACRQRRWNEINKATSDATTGPSSPVPQIQEQIEEVAKTYPQRRISERIVVKTTDVPVPQILKEVAEVVKAVKNDVPTPQILEENVEESAALHERVQQRTVEHSSDEQTVDIPTPQILEEIVEATSAPHERVQQRTIEHVAAVKNVLQERIPELMGVQIVDAVPHSQPQNLQEVVEVVKAVKNVPQNVFLRRLVNRSTTTAFPSINQVTKHVEIPSPAAIQRHVPLLQATTKMIKHVGFRKQLDKVTELR